MNIAELENRTRDALRGLRATAPAVAAVLADYRRTLAAIAADETRTDDWRTAQHAAALEAATADLDRIAATVETHTAGVTGTVAAASAPPEATDEALLHEQRLSRAWDRARRMLESGSDPIAVARLAAETQDAAMATALRAELPAWLHSDGRPLDNSTRRTIEPTLAAVEETVATALPEVDRRAAQLAAEGEQLAYFARLCVDHARSEVAGGMTVDVLPVTRTELVQVAA